MARVAKEKDKDKEYSVPALDKAISILNALAESELSISEIYTQLELPKSTTFVILNTLEQHDIIKKTTEGKYRLGQGMFRWSMSYLKSMDMLKIARPHMERLVRESPYTAHLAVLYNEKAVYIDKVEGAGFVRFATTVGQSNELHASGVGKALASGLTDEEIARMINEKQSGPSDKGSRSLDKMMEDVRFVREHGFSIEDEEFEEGIRCIGAPIYDYTGNVVASMSITSLSKDLPGVKFITVGESVKQAAEGVSKELGFQGSYPAAASPK
ncbi:IclR family transcriptional regulator [Paenibacillus sp. MBLB4367]|uniref:IclR family transcriptional regulator n=1 Tax=Paenibacillus sp. MBLB4367 TaxID=3384767 RepID=UPI00390842C5